ncbi:sec1 family domain-containing protein 2 [Cephus cinctus]|uniref:Sec1 family domain-containing protein 2 n=1 Tax=Cephus cinctus TaxID=211228 RepID=A0AAJ7FDG3_CEPCN|nr:sec1 family domain-containing protein 2 [Cephus cinctus]
MDTVNQLQAFANTCWKDIFFQIRDAAVYIDHSAAECLHWYQGDKGFLLLKEAGAVSVHELAMYNFHYTTVTDSSKAVLIYTSTDPLFYQRTLKLIIEKNTFNCCVVVCAVHSSILNYTSLSEIGEDDSYDKLKKDILSWMNFRNPLQDCHVDIMFRPIFTASINKNVFITPPFGDLMPPVDVSMIKNFEVEVDFLVSSFHSLCTCLNVKDDIFAIGKLSEYAAEKLEKLPSAIDRRKNLVGQNGVSIILVDRTLDLCTATSYNTESLLGRILSTLPHLPHHRNDVAVNMSQICPEMEESSSLESIPGCLASADTHMMEILIAKKQKDVLLSLNKLLTEMAMVKESPKTRLATRVSVHSLEKLLHKFRNIENIEILEKSSKHLQQIIAVIQALKSNKTAQLELLISLEKLILQNLAASRDSSSILAQLSNIIKTRSTRGLDMEHLLVLLTHIYALAGTEVRFATQQEKQLEHTLADAFFEDIKKYDEILNGDQMSIYHQTLLLMGATDGEKAQKSTQKMAEYILHLLRGIGNQRQSLANYESLMIKPSPQELAQSRGIIERLTTDLLDPAKEEIQDIQGKTTSLISAGFNLLLKGRTKLHPSDNPWIIIYVLGGITAEEARLVESIVSLHGPRSPRITLAGSRLLSPLDVMNKVLLSNVDIFQN